jgi:hypothetical protein
MVAQPDDGTKSQCLSDYAVFARIPTIEHNPTKHQVRLTMRAMDPSFCSNSPRLVLSFCSVSTPFLLSSCSVPAQFLLRFCSFFLIGF